MKKVVDEVEEELREELRNQLQDERGETRWRGAGEKHRRGEVKGRVWGRAREGVRRCRRLGRNCWRGMVLVPSGGSVSGCWVGCGLVWGRQSKCSAGQSEKQKQSQPLNFCCTLNLMTLSITVPTKEVSCYSAFHSALPFLASAPDLLVKLMKNRLRTCVVWLIFYKIHHN